MQTIFDCLDVSSMHDTHKADYTEEARKLRFDDQSRLMVPRQLFGGVPPLAPTAWAWGQVFSKLAPAVYGKGSQKTLPGDYLLSIPPRLLATNLNDHLSNINGTVWLVRAYDEICRAVLSDGFTTIGNTEILDVLAGVVEQNQTPDFKLVRPSVLPDEINIKSVWKNIHKPGGDYGIGVYVGNGEIGNRRLRIYPIVQRHSCTNSIIVEHDKGIEFVHRGNKFTKMVQIKSVIAELFGLAAEVLEKMIAAEAEAIPHFTDVLAGLSAQYGWDDKTYATVAIGTEGKDTRAGLVNGITFAAHAIEREPSEQADMEILGGRILMAPDSLFHQMAERVRK
jgi:hypothetical protein